MPEEHIGNIPGAPNINRKNRDLIKTWLFELLADEHFISPTGISEDDKISDWGYDTRISEGNNPPAKPGAFGM